MRNRPVAGRTYTREQWDELAINLNYPHVQGHAVHVNPNYSCEGVYGPKQRVHMHGYIIMVWHRTNSLVSQTETVSTKKQVAPAIRRLILKVDSMCAHPETRELSAEEARKAGMLHCGMCYHVVQCCKCHEIYAYDSSD